jgi:hypothetical protein
MMTRIRGVNVSRLSIDILNMSAIAMIVGLKEINGQTLFIGEWGFEIKFKAEFTGRDNLCQ